MKEVCLAKGYCCGESESLFTRTLLEPPTLSDSLGSTLRLNLIRLWDKTKIIQNGQ